MIYESFNHRIGTFLTVKPIMIIKTDSNFTEAQIKYSKVLEETLMKIRQ